jgi:propionyl-CoA carboxylase beta chain
MSCCPYCSVRTTRRRICRALNMLRNKMVENPWKKHDNIPL